mmetsp:Transcript_31121/g.56378  ORF Transcript_31121/g.56378 Transcript_31121/m.56378 type:complete len:228 (-) Transcript_31121:465-1148(-)
MSTKRPMIATQAFRENKAGRATAITTVSLCCKPTAITTWRKERTEETNTTCFILAARTLSAHQDLQDLAPTPTQTPTRTGKCAQPGSQYTTFGKAEIECILRSKSQELPLLRLPVLPSQNLLRHLLIASHVKLERHLSVAMVLQAPCLTFCLVITSFCLVWVFTQVQSKRQLLRYGQSQDLSKVSKQTLGRGQEYCQQRSKDLAEESQRSSNLILSVCRQCKLVHSM